MRASRTLACVACVVVLTGCAGVPDIGDPAALGDPQAGTLTLANRTRHTIRFEALRFTGAARFEWPDGRRYDGDFVGGRLHGRGIEARTDGSRYEGEWQDDVPHGYGRLDYADGSSYDGDWSYGRRSGIGRFARSDGSSYEGEWEDDLPNGFGIMSDRPGLIYEGALQDGQRAGYGALDFGGGFDGDADGDVGYEGMWLDDRRHGWGRETRPDGSTYVGQWRHDLRHGTGTERHVDGSYHDGTWEADRPHGPGTRRTSEGVEIRGRWNGNFVTKGVVALPSGAEYTGRLYASGNRTVDARFLAWLESRAALDDRDAQCLLGNAYRLFATPPPDSVLAAHWYERAAANGSAEAAFHLAEILAEAGSDHERMIDALETAAERGHARANSRLAALYQLGNLVAKDHARARALYEAAMRAGDGAARNNLAWLLATTPDDSIRDGARAVRLAMPVALFYDHWVYLDTLAAAHAAAGDFDAARRTEARALELAEGDAADELVAEMRARLEGFERGEPYQER